MDKQFKDAAYKEDFKLKSGVAISTARSQLVKKLLFESINQLGKNICFRCNLPMTCEDFSLEHIKPYAWETNAYELFMDTDNITFSHVKCNVAVTRNTDHKIKKRRERSRVKPDGIQCSRCLKVKPGTDFHNNKKSATGKESLCKPCRKDSR